MKTLAIDTTSQYLTVSLDADGARYSVLLETAKTGHSRLLMPSVDKLLGEAGIKAAELDFVAVTVGPGSFTGIRIGVATATALAYASGAKRVAVNSFELIAYNRAIVTAAVDAGHGNLYIAHCENGSVISTDFVQAEELDKMKSAGLPKIEFVPTVARDLALSCVAEAKIKQNCFVEVFEPLYLRKSQAERGAQACAEASK
jgi:tRNA threonylcarbamoyl adenosine modification protein YeaZ